MKWLLPHADTKSGKVKSKLTTEAQRHREDKKPDMDGSAKNNPRTLDLSHISLLSASVSLW